MKKILLISLLLVSFGIRVSFAGDLPLSFSDVIVYPHTNADGTEATLLTTFDPATGVCVFGNNDWNPAIGWDFTANPISSLDYPQFKVVFAEQNAATYIECHLKYVDDTEDYFGIPTGVTTFIMKLNKDVKQIYFESTNWSNWATTTPPYPSFTIAAATLLAPYATEKVSLAQNLSDMGRDWGSGPCGDNATGIVTLANAWEFVGWYFVTNGVTGFPQEPLDADVYVGAGFVFDPMPKDVTLKYTTAAGVDAYIGIPENSTSIEVAFAEPISKLGFQANNNGGKQITIKEAYLLKKAQTGLKKINANTGPVDVYTILGVKIRSQVERANALKGLQKGIYIVDGKKVLVTTATL